METSNRTETGAEVADQHAVNYRPRSPHIVEDHPEERALLLSLLAAVALLSIGAQIWRSRHPKSFKLVTLALLWILPAIAAVTGHWHRFLFIWFCWSAGAGYLLQRVLRERPLRRETPGLMYRVIDVAYKVVSGLAVVSYMGLIFLMVSMPPRQQVGSMPVLEWIVSLLVALCAQSVYFGVLIRDLAELGAEHVAHALGYTKKDDDEGDAADPPRGMCALCATYLPGWDPASVGAAASRVGGPVGSSRVAGGGPVAVLSGAAGSTEDDPESTAAALLALDSDDSDNEGDVHPFGDVERKRHSRAAASASTGVSSTLARVDPSGRGAGASGGRPAVESAILRLRAPDGSAIFRLPCGHEFHETCLKGWVLIGKKNRCPCCSERVELAAITGRTLLGKPTLLWANLLTVARYLVVWLPLLLLLSRFFLYEAGVQLLPPGHTHSPLPSPIAAPPSDVAGLGADGGGDAASTSSNGPTLIISG